MVSIIIPTHNRSQLLGATLDSILAQTYRHWECIVVDDSSTDYTEELMEFYCAKNSRINFFSRPENRRKGANACRNYGFEKSRGQYIQWFDSDDLMVPEFLEIKLAAIEKQDVDFVISKSANFQDPNPEKIISRNEHYYQFDKFEITNFNYVTQKINWLTYDFLGRRDVCVKVKYNEQLQSAQERNFFSILTLYTTKVKIIDQYLTLRRIHGNSTQFRLRKNKLQKRKEHLQFFLTTWLDFRRCGNKNIKSKEYLFKEAIEFTMSHKAPLKSVIKITSRFLEQRKYKKAFWYFTYQLSETTFKKGNLLRRKFRDEEKK